MRYQLIKETNCVLKLIIQFILIKGIGRSLVSSVCLLNSLVIIHLDLVLKIK